METPSSSSTRRVTSSQAIFAIINSDKTEDSNRGNKEDRSYAALIDITNDSPIVGLALQTPPSGFMVKRRSSRIKNTPGSGEALLRGQVKTLLHKEVNKEETEHIHSIKTRPFIHLVTSPMRLLAPTPANTPQFPNFSDNNDVKIKIASPIVAEHLRASQIFEEKEEKSMSIITRSLMFDFTTDKSEEDVDGLCKGEKKTPAEFARKRSRLMYNSNDEKIVEVKEVLLL
ncbi:PREDICTED: uncharacterized protein LOC104711663 isoform X2 [Camelina sativa]|uniref:Uncharacterized protein LOC104711663 isoform X2 n=1 Tax=Camelina sativa TaxID=90675 RepID=A0ABM0THX7_CAMSA|nr:PREDICTED: uncharacterized protein LOC104711663 isoform X2 [Camelina sativa]